MESQRGRSAVAWLAGLASVCAVLLIGVVGASPAAAQGTQPACLDPGADAFDGTSLDLENRWTSTLRHDDALYEISDGTAKVQTGPYEIQENEQGEGAANIFLQPAPAGTWEVTTKVSISQTNEGQQAGLLVSDPTGNDIVKLTYVQKQDGANGNKWIEFLKIVDGQYDFSGTWHSPESADYPDELMLKYRSDGDTLSGFYSVDDGETWLSAGDSRNYEAIDDPQVGFYALRGDVADPAVTAEFESFDLVPANDEFEGDALDECRWTEIFNRNDEGMSVGDGQLTLRTLEGELSNDESGVQNLILQDTNDSDWQATTKLTMEPTAAGQQAGLVIWGDNSDPAQANYVKLVFVRKNGNATNNGWIEFLKTTNGETDFGESEADWNSGLGTYGPDVYLRLVSAGGDLSAYWSDDGEEFTKVGLTHPTTGIENPQVGLMALKGTDDPAKPEVDARFDWFRIEPSDFEPPADPGIFDTIGITQIDTRANSEINGSPSPYSYIGEQMPPSKSVGAPGDDADDDVPLRMPDTRGNLENFASFAGQVIELPEAQQRAYSRLHFFGTGTDNGGTPTGGDFTLTFADGTTETVTVRFRDWANSAAGTPDDHVAITTNPRYTRTGTQGNINFYIYHKPVAVSEANRSKVLRSVTLPPNSTPGSAVVRAYLMALTLEAGADDFVMPNLGGPSEFPNDTEAPETTATVDPAAPDGENGWYKQEVTVSLETEDEDGGSGVEMVEYRLDGGAWLDYEDPVVVDTEGDHAFQYRSMDRAGNLSTQQSVAVKIDSQAPEVETVLTPELAAGATWYDAAPSLMIDPWDGNGSGVVTTEYSVDGGAWQAYTGEVQFTEDGSFEVAYRATDAAGNTSLVTPLVVQVDTAAPTTTIAIGGAAPVGTYGQPAVVTLTAADGGGSGVPAGGTEYRLDGGAWTDYTAPVTVSALGLHRVEYRSVDTAGNPEATKQVAFNRVEPPTGGQGSQPPGSPAPEPTPWVALNEVRRSQSTLKAFRKGRLTISLSCQAVEGGTVRLAVSRKVAKRLKLAGRTLAQAEVVCEGAVAEVTLQPGKKVRRKLAGKKGGAVKATLSVRLGGDAGSATDSAKLTLRR